MTSHNTQADLNSKPQPQPISLSNQLGLNQEQEYENNDKICSEKEELYVHQVYQTIAPHFSDTRYKPWPVAEKFLTALPQGWVGADVGCGNGKYLGVNTKLYTIGSDRCSNLIEICSQRGHEAMVADNLHLPYRTGCFDFAISIAVIHHFTTPARRSRAIQELARILRPGGRLLVFVWALEQKGKRQFDPSAPDVLVPWVLPQKFKPESEKDSQVYQRYYHLFQEGELEKLAEKAPLTISETGYDRDNWWVEFRKV